MMGLFLLQTKKKQKTKLHIYCCFHYTGKKYSFLNNTYLPPKFIAVLYKKSKQYN